MLITTIEDLISYMCDPINGVDHSSIDPKDKGILFSMSAQLKKSLAFTLRQSELIMKILIRNQNLYSNIPGFNMLMDNPTYKNNFRSVDSSKKIFLTTFLNNRAIAVKFPFDSKINNVISSISGKIAFDKDSRSHIFNLTESSILRLVNNFSNDFIIDQEILDWYDIIKDVVDNPLSYVPTLDFDNELILKNANRSLIDFFEENKNGNLVHDVFISKLAKMSLSKNVLDMLDAYGISDITKKILTSNLSKFDTEIFKGENTGIFNFLSDVSAWPVMIVLSDHNEVDKNIEEFYSCLTNIGIDSSEICVLFRSTSNKKFNDFIRDNGLNTLLSNSTKVVFIKHKMPKLLYRFNFNPKIILSGFSYHAHYTTQKMVDSHPFVLYYTEVRTIT